MKSLLKHCYVCAILEWKINIVCFLWKYFYFANNNSVDIPGVRIFSQDTIGALSLNTSGESSPRGLK